MFQLGAIQFHIRHTCNNWKGLVTQKTEKPTENSKNRTEPKPKSTDFSKTEPNRNRIKKTAVNRKGLLLKFLDEIREKIRENT